MKKIAFFGGSNPAGAGFPDAKNNLQIYPNLIRDLGFEIENYSAAGVSNYETFIECCKFLSSSHSDIVCIEWSNFHRWRFHIDPFVEIWISANQIKFPDITNKQHNYFGISRRQIIDLQKLLLVTSHDYHNILTTIDYAVIVQNLCKKTGIKHIAINGNVPLQADLFQHYSSNIDFDNALSDYAKDLLDIDRRPDNEIHTLLDKLATQFDLVAQEDWVNIFNPFHKNAVDTAPLGHHFGPHSHTWLADQIKNCMIKNNII